MQKTKKKGKNEFGTLLFFNEKRNKIVLILLIKKIIVQSPLKRLDYHLGSIPTTLEGQEAYSLPVSKLPPHS